MDELHRAFAKKPHEHYLAGDEYRCDACRAKTAKEIFEGLEKITIRISGGAQEHIRQLEEDNYQKLKKYIITPRRAAKKEDLEGVFR